MSGGELWESAPHSAAADYPLNLIFAIEDVSEIRVFLSGVSTVPSLNWDICLIAGVLAAAENAGFLLNIALRHQTRAGAHHAQNLDLSNSHGNQSYLPGFGLFSSRDELSNLVLKGFDGAGAHHYEC